MSVVYTQKILFPRFPLINMPLFHRRALLNSLPAHKRGDAKRAYKKTVADLGASVVMFFVVALVCTLTYHEFVNPNTDRPSGLSGSTQRLLASHQSNSSNLAPSPSATAVKKTIGPPNFPNALVSPYENGGVIVYLIGMIYTFMGLAVVCDEFFVPALEVMIDRFGISDDVAGATLMAAGGSAPELTTSLIGTFLSESDVGFGTIVGSAVFNVLFVIGMCAVFSKEVLKLTWWPLFRDSTYYILALGLLALFFGGPTKESKFLIEFWEALLLFLAYIGYVVVMKFNVQLQKKVTKCFGAKTTVPHNDAGEASAQYVDGSPDKAGTKAQTTDELNIPAGTGTTKPPKIINGNVIQMLPQNPLLRPANFRVGVLQMVLKEQDPEEQIRVKVVAQIVGDVHDTFSAIDSNGTDTIDKEEFRELIRQLSGGGLSTDEIKQTSDEVFNTIDLDGNKEVSFNEFQQWYLKSETRVMNDVKKAFDEIDVTEDGFVKREHFKKVVDELGMTEYMTETAESQAMHMFIESKESREGFINFEQFISWYRASMLWERHNKKNEEIAAAGEESEGLDLSWPSTGRGRLTYIIWAPIIIPLALTIYDCRKPKYVKYFLVTFIMSIVWVAIYSYLMVWFATLVGDAAGISDYIMGLTVLAAGTSVPDLLTSVIVARQGHGDMAVSSSIGSNIFDITVGLPVPWMLSTIIRWKPQVVSAESLLMSVFTLMIMLLGVICVIAASGWQMTKKLGFTMFFMYGVFVGWDLLRAYVLTDINL